MWNNQQVTIRGPPMRNGVFYYPVTQLIDNQTILMWMVNSGINLS